MERLMLPFLVTCLLYSGSASLLVLDYPISLYHADSRLSTVLWLRPAYCLYEQWTRETLDPSQASHWTATLLVEAKAEGSNSTYKIGQRFPVPRCSPVVDDTAAYGMGPTLVCLNDSCTKPVLPGHGYSVRFVLYNQAQCRLAATKWSQLFHTRDLPRSFRSIETDFRGASGGRVAVIVLLSITVFILLAGVWFAISNNNHRS
ncbi:uncharacterized protein LOC100560003 [Anolis carolinensis]|uniref:uncharacterized protein LOC100560003 n=1 Tax=Anolis carolinensis TaxID=28377 RepID=UPI002F2B2310